MIQLDWWSAIEAGINLFLFVALPAIILIWLVCRSSNSPATPPERLRSQPPSADPPDGIPTNQGASVSYFPGERSFSKGGFPVSGLGDEGRGGYGARPRDKDE